MDRDQKTPRAIVAGQKEIKHVAAMRRKGCQFGLVGRGTPGSGPCAQRGEMFGARDKGGIGVSAS
jgi:hypothetical protein